MNSIAARNSWRRCGATGGRPADGYGADRDIRARGVHGGEALPVLGPGRGRVRIMRRLATRDGVAPQEADA